jgi:predicted Fe-Mo cluster-binding NifX family protein
MLVAVPSETDAGQSSPVAGHFGRAPFFVVVDTESGHVKAIENDSSHFGGAALPPELLAANGVQAVLCHGMGLRAINLCAESTLSVYIGTETTVADMVAAFREGRLRAASEADGCVEGHH